MILGVRFEEWKESGEVMRDDSLNNPSNSSLENPSKGSVKQIIALVHSLEKSCMNSSLELPSDDYMENSLNNYLKEEE